MNIGFFRETATSNCCEHILIQHGPPKKTGDTPTWQRGSISGGTPIAGQLMENPIYNWMMARGTLYFKKPPNRKHNDDKVMIPQLEW